jgi:hypothetical protein
MDKIQDLKIENCWNEWDDINLSSPELRQERLEILICQKLKNGEDISQCLQVLDYLKAKTVEEHLSKMFIKRIRDKWRMEAWRQAGFIALTVFVALTCCVASFKLFNVLDSVNTIHQQKQGYFNVSPRSSVKHDGN